MTNWIGDICDEDALPVSDEDDKLAITKFMSKDTVIEMCGGKVLREYDNQCQFFTYPITGGRD